MFSHHPPKPILTTRCARLLGALALAAVVAGCAATSPGKTAVRLDDTPRTVSYTHLTLPTILLV